MRVLEIILMNRFMYFKYKEIGLLLKIGLISVLVRLVIAEIFVLKMLFLLNKKESEKSMIL